MGDKPSYEDYVKNLAMLSSYAAYQERYAAEPRESDKVLISHVARLLAERDPKHGPPTLLDIGCSTGNLLLHLRAALPGLRLRGADLAVSFVDACRSDPRLAGIEFSVLDILDLPEKQAFDVVVANAVAVYFGWNDYERALASVAASLKPGGWYLAFEWLHPFEQDLEITETSRSHPRGLKIYFRPFSRVSSLLDRHGFSRTRFEPFRIPIDLPRGATYTDNRDGFEDLNTYTVRSESGETLLFRGALYQPWCHLITQRIG